MRLQLTGIALAAALVSGSVSHAAEATAKKSVPATKTPAPAAETAPAKNGDNVRITLQTTPLRKAFVNWGKKKYGAIPAPKPLVVVRPRDSGPLDLVIRTAGYLTVHTRAYTFSDSTMRVKLTPVAEKNTLFGYREELPPEGEAGPAAAQDPSAPTQAPAQAEPAPQAATAR